MRIKRTIDVAMSNYTEITGFSVFNCEGKVAYAAIIQAWNGHQPSFMLKNLSFITALSTEHGFVAINPEGAVSLIVGTNKGVWFVAVFAPMDVDKEGILKECIQAAKNLEVSVSVFDV